MARGQRALCGKLYQLASSSLWRPERCCDGKPGMDPPLHMHKSVDIVLRLGASVLTGTAIGINRDLANKPIGMRERLFALVALGAAVVSLAGASHRGDRGQPGCAQPCGAGHHSGRHGRDQLHRRRRDPARYPEARRKSGGIDHGRPRSGSPQRSASRADWRHGAPSVSRLCWPFLILVAGPCVEQLFSHQASDHGGGKSSRFEPASRGSITGRIH